MLICISHITNSLRKQCPGTFYQVSFCMFIWCTEQFRKSLCKLNEWHVHKKLSTFWTLLPADQHWVSYNSMVSCQKGPTRKGVEACIYVPLAPPTAVSWRYSIRSNRIMCVCLDSESYAISCLICCTEFNQICLTVSVRLPLKYHCRWFFRSDDNSTSITLISLSTVT